MTASRGFSVKAELIYLEIILS